MNYGMTTRTLREFVELWRSIYSHDAKPSVFISQKITETQEDKIETRRRTYPLASSSYTVIRIHPPSDWIKYSSRIREETCSGGRIEWQKQTNGKYQYIETIYKYIPENNTADFQLKPPIKSLFTGISGPYKK